MFKNAECESCKSIGGQSKEPNYYTGSGKPEKMELAEAYVPFQKLRSIYTPMEALTKGTIFPELYRPYKGQ